MKNLDREPGFLLTVAILLPFMAAASILAMLPDRWWHRRRP